MAEKSLFQNQKKLIRLEGGGACSVRNAESN